MKFYYYYYYVCKLLIKKKFVLRKNSHAGGKSAGFTQTGCNSKERFRKIKEEVNGRVLTSATNKKKHFDRKTGNGVILWECTELFHHVWVQKGN